MKEYYLSQGYHDYGLVPIIDGYKPDAILENEDEVLFLEAVATTDHEVPITKQFNGKPVQFVKWYSLRFFQPAFGKTIMVDDETHRLLTERGNKGESYDDIIRRLLTRTEKAVEHR